MLEAAGPQFRAFAPRLALQRVHDLVRDAKLAIPLQVRNVEAVGAPPSLIQVVERPPQPFINIGQVLAEALAPVRAT